MLSRFFINRPIFAQVIAIVTMIFGGVSLYFLPVEQYPRITPPTVVISGVYPGANAQVVADTVAQPIEQQVNGVEGMLYMSSTSASDGSYSLTVTFEVGTDLDFAQVLVQNRVALAEPTLPEEVKRQGISVKKQSTNIVLVISLTSPDNTFDSLFLANYATLNLRDPLSRIAGVGETRVSGSGAYGMRIWLDPEKLRARSMTAGDVVAALQEQNVQVAAGQIGAPPAADGQNFQYTVSTLGRLSDVEQFEEIVVKNVEDRLTRLRDVARVELGGQVYDQFAERSGLPAASVLVYQSPGANAIEVARLVRLEIERLSRTFPEGLEYEIPFDTTLFVSSAIREVYTTLIEAGVLVLIVILVFLQDWRAVLVPATTVPVTILGAFAFMPPLGFTVNLLTLFGLILAIGIVVDDAIVIVENAAHHIDHNKLDPRSATIRAMDEVTGPVIGITLVLMAVFLPTAFLGGITGQLYRQFALTIAATAFLSAVNALTLKPVQCAAYLRPSPSRRNILARAFNRVYGWVESAYVWVIGRMIRVTPVMLLVYAGITAGTFYWYTRVPTAFLPTEDQGYIIAAVQLPDAASQERTREVVERINGILKETEGIDTWFVLGGFSLLDGAALSNAATFFAVFDPWDKRTRPDLSQDAILGRLRGAFSQIPEASILAFAPPAIQGLGTTGGFQMQVEDRENAGADRLQAAVQLLIDEARKRSELGPINSTFRAGVPQLYADIDRVKAKTLDLRLNDVFSALQAYLGSAYVNDFNKFGRTYQVRVQADSRFRLRPEDITRLDVRNRQGEMVPLATVVDVRESFGPQIVNRYNLYPTAAVTGQAASGYSSGESLQLMEQLAQETFPPGIDFEWTGISYQEKKIGNQAIGIFALAVLLVYLVLAAQYESWILPLAVILVVPLGLLGAVAALEVRAMDNNVYTQIGIVLIIALASKNAILIVEFARELRQQGKTIREAALDASRLRFRPILMTSFAFILGVVPLVRAEGAGAASRQSIGTVVFGGMLASTIFAVFFVPIFFVAFQWLAEKLSRHKQPLTRPVIDPA